MAGVLDAAAEAAHAEDLALSRGRRRLAERRALESAWAAFESWAARRAALASGWRHAMAYEDAGGDLRLYRQSVALRIAIGDRGGDPRGCVALADALILGRLAADRPPPAGFWPVLPEGKRRFQPLELAADWRTAPPLHLLWPVLDLQGAVPACLDLIALDRQDATLWRLARRAADCLVWGDPAEAAQGGTLPLRLHRAPRAWLEAVNRDHEPAEGEAPPRPPARACILDPRGELAQRLLTEFPRLVCDDVDHAEQVQRWQSQLLPAPKKPEILVAA